MSRIDYLYHMYLFGLISDRDLAAAMGLIDDEPIACIRVALKMIKRGNNEK